MASPTVPSHLFLGDLESQIQGHPSLKTYISSMSLVRPYVIILKSNRKPYMGSSIVPSHLTLSYLEMSKSR